MLYFYEFDNKRIGDYDVILHATEDEMKKILDHFDVQWAVPDCLPAEYNKMKTDLYLYFINSGKHEIVPVWSINYAYGHLYNGDGPVGEELPDFSMDLGEYSFTPFTPMEEEKMLKENLDRNEWPGRTRVFPLGKRRYEE